MPDDFDANAPALPDTDTAPDPEAAALSTLAKPEDISAYVKARTGADVDKAEPDEHPDRVEQALEEARQRTRETREQTAKLDQEYQAAEQEWLRQQQAEQALEQQRAAELSYYEQRGRTQEKAALLKQQNPEVHQKIVDNLTALEGSLNPEQQKALERALVYHPESIWNFAMRLSDDSDGTTMADKFETVRNSRPDEIFNAAAQGSAQLQQERYVQTRIMQDRLAHGRRFTAAPPPFSAPRVGASPPRKLSSLAQKENINDYFAYRRRQLDRER